ncbi:hypothetical protein [Fictibacillus fluitans]|uniref:Uncharacterized protein n=1 Tax=Fictibacillus fluitans TaxID=3058422 RepID=A0ABT8HS81_9BACL|nr:hypothetical protein [Fictibacillus sp. NE201]MDN4523613.1 hypothetical protein [Fictibacillus sp. NE201]
MNLTFKQKKIGQMDSNFFHHIQPLLSYWGLQWNKDDNQIEPGMRDQSFAITGIEPEVMDRVKSFLRHTGAVIENGPAASARIRISVSTAADQPVPIAVETTGAKLLYITPSLNKPGDVQHCIHQSIVCKRKADFYVFSFRYIETKQMAEWISYLLIQIGLSSQFSSLASISQSEYQTAVGNILKPINPVFASLQIVHTPSLVKEDPKEEITIPDLIQQPQPKPFSPVPSIKPVPAVRRRNPQSGPPINPFKPVHAPPSTINPFRTKQKKTSAIINPFQPKTHTSHRPKE